MTKEDFATAILSMEETLYRVCYGLLGRPEDREDAVQEAIRIAWQKRHTLRQEAFLQTWVIRILINCCYAIIKKAKRETPMERLPESAPPKGTDGELLGAILALAPGLRMPVMLHYMEGYPLKDVAAMMGIPLGTVKSRLNRARKQLHVTLSEEVAAL